MNNNSINPTQILATIQASGSALREFYSSNGEERISAYSRFAKSCQQFADMHGYSFLDASQRIHSIYNIRGGK